MKILLLGLLVVVSLQMKAQPANYLSSKYAPSELQKLLIPQKKWTPFPHIGDRTGWQKADDSLMQSYLQKATSYIDYEWPAIPATVSLLIERTGERASYEKISFEKRTVLGTLLLGELQENKGRFIDAIINGIWSICEESFWGVSAHLPKTKENAGLMDVSKPFVDLFAAETATFLSWVDYFIGDKLDLVSPQIRKRIYYEVNNRIFDPLMTQPHGWMFANANGRPPNNWNPWICSNWLNTALLLEKNDTRRTEMVNKILYVLDQFLNPYPEDGGCDEGPGYWGAAAASLYDNLAMLNLATNNAFSYVYESEKIKNMARFIYRAQIGKEYFIDFADADPKPGMAASMIYRFGKAINDTAMMAFGAFYRKPRDGSIGRFQYFRNLFELFIQDEYRRMPQYLPLPADVWLPGIQVMAARDKAGSEKGFFVAAKGGHNDESHNHNDIGNYIVYYDGLPVLIDIGRGTYTRKTFSDKRYEIWNNCSDYHNLPSINGFTQPAGAAFRASNVSYKNNKQFAELQLNIATAYPQTSNVNYWERSVRLNRTKNIVVADKISLKQQGSFAEHLMTCYPAESKKEGEVIIYYKKENGESKQFLVQYNPLQLKVTIEKIPLLTMEDKGIQEKWGDNIYRITLSGNAGEKTSVKFVIKPE